MDRVILQVPMSKELKEKAEAVSADYGFSSLQETLRVIIAKLARKEITFKIEEKSEFIRLSPQAKKRYAKMKEDIEKGRNIIYTKDVNDFLEKLRS